MSRRNVTSSRKPITVLIVPDHRVVRAAKLDRAADVELVMGHVAIAERLARLAAEIREAAR